MTSFSSTLFDVLSDEGITVVDSGESISFTKAGFMYVYIGQDFATAIASCMSYLFGAIEAPEKALIPHPLSRK